MALGDYYVGRASAVGWALQAVASGTRWDGTPGTLRWFSPTGDASYNPGADQNRDGDMNVDTQSITSGATRKSGSFTTFLSYEHQELLAIAAAGGADSIAGSGPYTHTIALADDLVYLNVAYYYENFKGTRFQRTWNNATVTEFTLSFVPEERPKITINWVAQSVATSTPGAAPTLNTPDLVDWEHVSMTVGGSAVCPNDITFTVSQGIDTDDVGLCTDAPNVNTLFRSGQREPQITFPIGLDDVIEGYIDAPTTDYALVITCNNGESGADERDLTITVNKMRIATLSTNMAQSHGKRRESIVCVAYDWDGFVFTNSLSVAQV